MIARLIRENLVDYFAMDIKHTWERYSSLVGVSVDQEKYIKSIDLIISQAKDYEFRSTVIEGVHTESDIREMTSYIKEAKKYYLQNYRDSITLDPSFV